jgi:hypothetical protein
MISDIKMEKLLEEAEGAKALYMVWQAVWDGYADAGIETEKNPDDMFEAGREEAFWEVLEIINNRIAIVNAPYGPDEEDDE